MEDQAILEGFKNLKDGSCYDNLYQAALSRSKADWLVGMNATRLFTTLYQKRLTVGRVQTPTLSMIADRQKAITNFKKEKYFNLHLLLDGFEAVKDKIFDLQEANALLEKCQGKDAAISELTKNKKSIGAPKLYDLTTLQREANRYFGYTAKETLDVTQSLYEKKLVTYPRTDSQYLIEDMKVSVEKIAFVVKELFDFGKEASEMMEIDRLINNAKVTDHHAIIPTMEIKSQDLSSLSKQELEILKLISQQLLCAAGQKHEYLETEVKILCEEEVFKAKGKIVTSMGFKVIENAFMGKGKDQDKEESQKEEEKALPELIQGQTFSGVKVKLTEHFTSPPKAYTEDSLLSALETAGNEHFDEDTEKKGLGTPATRAAIIEKLVSSGYIKRKGKQLLPTEDGIKLSEIMPDEIKSPTLTALWENSLLEIERGVKSHEEFLRETENSVKELCSKYQELSDTEKQRFSVPEDRKSLGKCPRCGSFVYEGRKNFYCLNKACDFCIWKESRWLSSMKKKMTEKMAVSLLEKGRVHVKGLYSAKKDKTFDAYLLMKDDGEKTSYVLEFPKEGKENG